MDKQQIVMIGIPCMDSVKTRTMMSLFSASAVLKLPAKLHLQMNCYVHDAREKIAQEAIRTGMSHVMFIDQDMEFPPESIDKLIEQDKDIIGGLYYRRQAPHLPTINDLVDGKIVVPRKFPLDKTFKMWSVATGFMLVKTEVFKKIEPPWFSFGTYKGQKMGEDVYFCWKANKKGFEVWCDPTIKLGHVGEYSFGYEDYKAYDDVRPKEDTPDEFDGVMK